MKNDQSEFMEFVHESQMLRHRYQWIRQSQRDLLIKPSPEDPITDAKRRFELTVKGGKDSFPPVRIINGNRCRSPNLEAEEEGLVNHFQ